jgi:hypothetical protein
MYKLLQWRLTFYENPSTPATRRIQAGEFWLWEILGRTPFGRGRRKSSLWCLGLSEEVFQGTKFEFRVVIPKLRGVYIMRVNLIES